MFETELLLEDLAGVMVNIQLVMVKNAVMLSVVLDRGRRGYIHTSLELDIASGIPP